MSVILRTLMFTFYVYIRFYIMNILSLQTFCIKNATFHNLLRLKEEIELFLNRIPINMAQYKLNFGDHALINISRVSHFRGRQAPKGSLA
jgi:hypothetical protein